MGDGVFDYRDYEKENKINPSVVFARMAQLDLEDRERTGREDTNLGLD